MVLCATKLLCREWQRLRERTGLSATQSASSVNAAMARETASRTGRTRSCLAAASASRQRGMRLRSGDAPCSRRGPSSRFRANSVSAAALRMPQSCEAKQPRQPTSARNECECVENVQLCIAAWTYRSREVRAHCLSHCCPRGSQRSGALNLWRTLRNRHLDCFPVASVQMRQEYVALRQRMTGTGASVVA